MGKDTKKTLEFNLHGKFLGFAAEDGYKLKYLRLSTGTFEHLIQLPKEMRSLLYRSLTPGVWIQVSGYQKVDCERGRIKLKASQVVPIQSEPQEGMQRLTTVSWPVSQQLMQLPQRMAIEALPKQGQKPTILICQKSDCCKRGGAALTQALAQELSDRGLAEQVSIKGTGCMKQCKAGPNLVMPDKTRYTKIQAQDVAALVDRHFAKTANAPMLDRMQLDGGAIAS